MNDEHVTHLMYARTTTVRVELEQRISTFGVAPRGDPGEGASERARQEGSTEAQSDSCRVAG